MGSTCGGIALVLCLGSFACAEDAPKEAAKPALSATDDIEEVIASIKKTGAKVVFVNGWSSTCGFCLEELPAVAEAARELAQTPGVGFLGLSLDGLVVKGKAGDEAMAKALAETRATAERKKLPFANVVWCGAGEPLFEKLKLETTPYNAIFSAEGKLLAEVEVPEEPADAVQTIKRAVLEQLDKASKP